MWVVHVFIVGGGGWFSKDSFHSWIAKIQHMFSETLTLVRSSVFEILDIFQISFINSTGSI